MPALLTRLAEALPPPAVAALAGVVLVSGVVTALTAPQQAVPEPRAAAPRSAPASPGAGTAATTSAVPLPVTTAPAELLARVEAAVRAARTVRFAATTTRTPEGGETEVAARVLGVLDVVADAGRADVDLPGLADLAGQGAGEDAGTAAALEALSTASLRWTAQDLTLVAGEEEGTVERGSGTGGLLERLPDEPLGVLRLASLVEPDNADAPVDVDGVPTTLVEGTVDGAVAGEALGAALGGATLGGAAPEPALEAGPVPVDVWLDAQGRPLRVQVTTLLPPQGGLPVRRLETTYEFRDWGAPVDLGS